LNLLDPAMLFGKVLDSFNELVHFCILDVAVGCDHTAPLGGLLKIDSDFVQMVRNLEPCKASNLKDCLGWVRCEAL